jgi:hypothetical protein
MRGSSELARRPLKLDVTSQTLHSVPFAAVNRG